MNNDEEPGFLGRTRIAILGLGLMGGSLALALRGKVGQLIGVDPDPATLDLAREWRLADQLSPTPKNLLEQADVVVLAAPVRVILQLLEDLPTLHPGAPVVFDVGSTKREILSKMERLPARFDPLGGHPMCGKEHSSLKEAEAGLYRGAPFALVPLARTSPRARAFGQALTTAVGACPLWLDATHGGPGDLEHDRWVAATSHLPYLVSNALASCTPPEAAAMAGPGFRSSTRLAAQPPALMMDILATNRANVLGTLRRLHTRLDLFEQLLENGDDAELERLLAEGQACREKMVASRQPEENR
jgi:prephenate dehydrogenase